MSTRQGTSTSKPLDRNATLMELGQAEASLYDYTRQGDLISAQIAAARVSSLRASLTAMMPA